RCDFDVLCLGGEVQIEPEIRRALLPGMKCIRIEVSDDELALAYSGAVALVFPSLYEGFGLPVIEAMACGCPVITTRHGSLAEAAGDAALLTSGLAKDEMCGAILAMLEGSNRSEFIARGLAHVSRFSWSGMAETLERQMRRVVEEARGGSYDA